MKFLDVNGAEVLVGAAVNLQVRERYGPITVEGTVSVLYQQVEGVTLTVTQAFNRSGVGAYAGLHRVEVGDRSYHMLKGSYIDDDTYQCCDLKLSAV